MDDHYAEDPQRTGATVPPPGAIRRGDRARAAATAAETHRSLQMTRDELDEAARRIEASRVTDPKVSDLIRDRDAEGLAAYLAAQNIFVSSEMEARLAALMGDNLLNDSDVTEMIGGRLPDRLDELVDRIERTDRTALRAGRSSSLDEIEKTFDLAALGLNFKEIEQLEGLLESGRIDIRDVTEALRYGEIDLLRNEIEQRENDRLREHARERGREH
jgi:hypothetical protein